MARWLMSSMPRASYKRLDSPIANARTTRVPDCKNQWNRMQRWEKPDTAVAAIVRLQIDAFFMAWKSDCSRGRGPQYVASSTLLYCSRIIQVLKGVGAHPYESGRCRSAKDGRRKIYIYGGEGKDTTKAASKTGPLEYWLSSSSKTRSGQTVLQAHATGKITSLHRLSVEKE